MWAMHSWDDSIENSSTYLIYLQADADGLPVLKCEIHHQANGCRFEINVHFVYEFLFVFVNKDSHTFT